MALTHYLTAAPTDPPVSRSANKHAGSKFRGSVRQHPYDPRKLILVPYPYKSKEGILEFNRDDILFADNTAEVASQDGDILTIMDIHVKTGSHAVMLIPFNVD